MYGEELTILASHPHQMKHAQIAPQAGWLEHGPQELVENSMVCIEEAVKRLGNRKDDTKAVGSTNQQEATVLWNMRTGAPLHSAIVWSDGCTADTAESFAATLGSKDSLCPLCGLPLSTCFGAIKVKGPVDNVPAVKEAIQDSRLCLGQWIHDHRITLQGGRYMSQTVRMPAAPC